MLIITVLGYSETSGKPIFSIINEKSSYDLEFGEVCWGLTDQNDHRWKSVGDDPTLFPDLDSYFGYNGNEYQKMGQKMLDEGIANRPI